MEGKVAKLIWFVTPGMVPQEMRTSDPPGDAPRQVRSMTEQVAKGLRGRIQDERMQPGDRLGREEDLARDFGVSRPTMREAIRLLSNGGMLRAAKGPGGGIFVQRTPEDTLTHSLADGIATMLDVQAVSLEELVTARVAVEIPIVRLAAERIDQEAVDELDRIVDDIERAMLDGPTQLAADARFHRAIARASGNPMLQATIGWAFEVLQPRLYRAVPPSMVEDVLVHQHRAIVEALSRHDPAAAEAAMRAHLEHLRVLVKSRSVTAAR